jgi:hypothetical protein
LISEALTLGRNFGPWFLGVLLAGFLAGSYAGYHGGRLIYQGRAQRSESALQAFRAELATQVASGEISAQQRQAEALDAITARNDAVTTAVSQIAPQVLAAIQPQLAKFREATHAPAYDCLRTPLPIDALGVFQRPGGIASADH